ncbi:MFS transporter [Pleurocapsa sp. CCALA 161]|uniref:MFS transporter n=1 Tax=Pleurocapsa sp. CCALA 161 TaxID=2107688 RepID=UPI000D04AA85|nr:MFS transporter [Pleurocapsa sp. CCALA 161]PSB09491.1 MFS transporter [Pleurocapsa sp. CCALA 161]
MPKTFTLKNIPRNVWILGFVSLFTDTASKIIQSLLPLFLVSVLEVNLITVGTIEGIAESTASVLKVFSGALSDYWGKRKQLAIAGYGLSALVVPVFALANSPLWVLIGRFGDRVGKGIRVAPRNALVADVTLPEQRGAAYGLRQSLDTIGAAIGPLIAVALMSVSGQNFRLVFWLATIPGIIAVLLLIFGIKERDSISKNPQNPLQWQNWQNLDRGYWILLVVILIFNLGNSSDAFLLLRSQQVGINNTFIPLAFMVMNFTYFLSAYPAGVISDRMGRYGLITAGFLLYALIYLGFAYARTPWEIWSLFAGYGLYQGMSKGILLAAIGDRIPAELRGTAFGTIALATGIVLFPANFMAGFLWENVSYQAPFLFGSILSILAALLLLVEVKRS